MKAVVTDKWILCPVCRAKTRTQSRNEMFFACVFAYTKYVDVQKSINWIGRIALWINL